MKDSKLEKKVVGDFDRQYKLSIIVSSLLITVFSQLFGMFFSSFFLFHLFHLFSFIVNSTTFYSSFFPPNRTDNANTLSFLSLLQPATLSIPSKSVSSSSLCAAVKGKRRREEKGGGSLLIHQPRLSEKSFLPSLSLFVVRFSGQPQPQQKREKKTLLLPRFLI